MKDWAISKMLATGAAGACALLFCASSAFAQGCALCYNDAAAAGPQAQAALRHGILVLMFPPMIIFGGMFFLLYQRSKVNRETHSEALIPNELSSRSASEFVLHLN